MSHSSLHNTPLPDYVSPQKRGRYIHMTWFLALLVFTQQSFCHGAGVRPSVNSGFLETAAWIQTKFYGKLPIHHISRRFFIFFQKFKFSNYHEFDSFSLTWDPVGAKITKHYSSHKSLPNFLKLLLNFVSNILTVTFWISL